MCFKNLLVFLLYPLLASCAAIALSGAGLGINYTLTNVAYKTFNFPLDGTNKATIIALKRMDIQVINNSTSEKGRRINASTYELEIIIDLERITSKTTRIKVDAKEGLFFRDKATAAAIIEKVQEVLL